MIVASFTDAWIETFEGFDYHCIRMSHLLQMRGLKPHARLPCFDPYLSHLLQMRGLKHEAFGDELDIRESHLLQMRGLKRLFSVGKQRLL